MSEYYGHQGPELTSTFYAEEMPALFEAGELKTGIELIGHYAQPEDNAEVDSVLKEIKAAFIGE